MIQKKKFSLSENIAIIGALRKMAVVPWRGSHNRSVISDLKFSKVINPGSI
jgi:hypothetical protein